MYYINDTYINLYEINKSKFISYLCPYSDFEKTLKQAKKAHPKASHYVWAYRYLKNNVLFQKSYDDGEPKGCAGSPILRVPLKINIFIA